MVAVKWFVKSKQGTPITEDMGVNFFSVFDAVRESNEEVGVGWLAEEDGVQMSIILWTSEVPFITRRKVIALSGEVVETYYLLGFDDDDYWSFHENLFKNFFEMHANDCVDCNHVLTIKKNEKRRACSIDELFRRQDP